MKRTFLRRKNKKISRLGKSPVSKVKRLIQANLRLRAISRDGGCVLRHYKHWLPFQYQECGPRRKDGELILQAEHLVGRKNSKTYAEMDNIVCLCKRHHFYFKTQHGALYWEIIRKHTGEDRWNKVQEWAKEREVHNYTAKEWREKLNKLQSPS